MDDVKQPAPPARASSQQEIAAIDRWWRAANYLSAGQIYLAANPLLREPLQLAHIKPRLLGHWGTAPGINFIYAHLNRVIRARHARMLLVTGPGHGGPALLANGWLEGSYSDIYPAVGQDLAGMRQLFRQFSFPGGVPSHASPETPGSMHEGGELGYALSHAYGAAFDNPDLVVACIVGDGEAETGPLATSWHSNKFVDPVSDGAVLPILHLNGYKIAGPTVLARIPHAELEQLLRGYGHDPLFVEGEQPHDMHGQMMRAMDLALDRIAEIQQQARSQARRGRPAWPMIVLRSPKGWTGPREVDGKPVENSFRSHQVPVAELARADHLEVLDRWLRSYRPEELFDAQGCPRPDLRALAPEPALRLSLSPQANGGSLLRPLRLPDIARYAVSVVQPGAGCAESTAVQGRLVRDVVRQNPDNFRVFSPDETASNRWSAVFEATDRVFAGQIVASDEHLAARGRVMEMLSEHQCQGWLEGYLLSGRHGFFSCYEAFIHIIDSMLNQHAKWLKVAREVPWRRPIASLNYLLSSHVWRQDHNGFSHQDPGFLDHVVNKKAEFIRIYLPPDANTLLCVTDHCLRSRNLINVIVAGKQPEPQWLTLEQARAHCSAGIGTWDWAGNEQGSTPDVVMACCGDVPTLETLAAVDLLRRHAPELRVRVINVVDLMKLQPASEHPHGLSDDEYVALFTARQPVVFAFHGYPWLIHRLAYRRPNHEHLHVRGYKEEGTTTTPFDMTVRNDLDRYHLAMAALQRVPRMAARRAELSARFTAQLDAHRAYIREHGEDMPEIRDWKWSR